MKRALCMILFAVAFVGPTFAYTWTGGGTDNNWTNPSNWGGGGYPQSASDTAEFTTDATVSLDSGNTLTVGYVKVAANKTVTLNGTTGSVLNPVKAAAVDGNGFVIAANGKLILNVPISSTGRIDKWGAGELVVNANFTAAGSSYPFLIDNGTVTVQGTAVLSVPNGTLGLCNGIGSEVRLVLKDSAQISAKDVTIPVGTTSVTGVGRIVQEGEETVFDVAHEIVLAGPSGTSNLGTYELRNGTLSAPAVTLGKSGSGNDGAYAGGRFVQSGGRAVIGANFVTVRADNPPIDISGGTLAFGTTSNRTIGAPLNLSGKPTIEISSNIQLYLPAETTIADGTSLTKTGGSGSILFVTNDLTVAGSLTVDKGYFLAGDFSGRAIEISAPPGDNSPWPVTVKDGGIFQATLINSRVTRPLALSVESGGKIRFPYSDPYYNRSILVAHSLVVNGVAQAKGRYTPAEIPDIFTSDSAGTASIVVPYVWTGAGDGTSWSDAANWDGGAVPPSAATTAVDLSRAAGKTVVLNDEQTLTCVIFNPQGHDKKATISGTGKIVQACESFRVGMFVGIGRELVLDIDVDKVAYANYNTPAIVGGGRVTVKRNFPGILSTHSYKHGAYVLDGELAFAGTTAFLTSDANKLSGFGTWELAGRSKIVFEDGCSVTAFRLDPSPMGLVPSDEWVQNGGNVSLYNFYFTCYSGYRRTPFSYTLNAGNLSITGDFCLGSAYYMDQPRFPGGDFVMNGGTLRFNVFKCQRNNNYLHLNGGDVYVKSGFTDTYGTFQGTITNEQSVKIGGATIHSTGTWSNGLTTEFTGRNGAATFDTAGYNATFSKAVSGVGGLVKNGNGILTFSAAATFTGPVIINGGSVVFGSAVNGPTDFTVRSGILSFQSAMLNELDSIEVPTANDLVVNAASTGLSVKRLVIDGVVQPSGSVSVNGGTVNVRGTDMSVWQGPSGGNWSAAANWTGTVPNGAAAGVDFGFSTLATESTIVIDTAITLKDLAYRHPTDGASLSLAGPGEITLSADGTIYVPAGNTLVVNVTMNLLGKTTKKGQGKLVLNGILTSQGDRDVYFLVVEEGDVEVNGAVNKCRIWTASATQRPTLTIGTDAVVSNTVSINAGWMGYGDIVQNGGIVDLNPPTKGFETCWYLAQSNGKYTLNGGVLSLYKANSSFGYSNGAILEFVQNGGTLQVGEFCKSGVPTGRYTYTLNGGTNEIETSWIMPETGRATAYLNGGTIISGSNTAMFSHRIDMVFGGEVSFAQKAANVAVTLGSKMTGAGTIRQAGPGTLTLAGTPVFYGAVVVDGGTFAFAEPVHPDTDLAIAAGATVSVDCEEVVVRTLSVNGNQRRAGTYSASGDNLGGRIVGSGVLVVLEGNDPGTMIIFQ